MRKHMKHKQLRVEEKHTTNATAQLAQGFRFIKYHYSGEKSPVVEAAKDAVGK
ncbi:BQ2448_383 [Microbotryum intermedium]|uniref:BQ2448_383 protein n=1 Tax=Microbotryum intermedium TaxID=269621 RepID=A0A238F2A3_9BASI|nr:BQ2448_383 [Microbotryum intermedium]